MKVAWTPIARACALECAVHIAADDPDAAARWLHGLIGAVARLADFPDMGRAVAESGVESQREVLYGRYRVRYRVGDSVTVVGVRHMSRQMDALDRRDE